MRGVEPKSGAADESTPDESTDASANEVLDPSQDMRSVPPSRNPAAGPTPLGIDPAARRGFAPAPCTVHQVGSEPDWAFVHVAAPEVLQGPIAAGPELTAHAALEQPGFELPPQKYRLSEAHDGHYRGRLVVGAAGILGTTIPTGVSADRRGTRHRPDTVLDGFYVGQIRVAVASLRGMSHHVHRSNRQDAYSLGLTPGDRWLVIALADGVSSGPLSEEAADAATEAAVRGTLKALRVTESLELDWATISQQVRAAVRGRAEVLAGRRGTDAATGAPIEPASLSDATLANVMSTTAEILVVSTMRQPGEGHDFVRVLISGDGSAFRLDPLRGISPVGSAKSVGDDGLTSHAVRPLPFDVGDPEVDHGILLPGQAITAMTDGFGGQVGRGMNAFGSHLLQTLCRPLDTVEYLRAVSYINEGANDDRTIATVWATEEVQ